MDSNFGVLGGTLIVAMVLLYLSLKTGAPPEHQGSRQTGVTNRSELLCRSQPVRFDERSASPPRIQVY